MAKKKKKEQQQPENHDHDESTCPECGKKSKPIVEIYDGKHFSVWGNDDFMTINFNFNDVTITCPTDLWSEMKGDLHILSMIPIPYSDENDSLSPEELN